MENKDISQIALQKIKENGIKPISKNIFNLKKVIFWSFVGTSIIVGAISFSVIISILFNNDWILYKRFGFNFIFKSLPYFWFVCLLLFAILGEFYYRRTLLGYRHRLIVIIGTYITITVIAGSIMHIIGLGKIVEESLSRNISIYNNFMFDKNEFWSQPKEGLISGRIVSIEGDIIRIVDFNNNTWILDVDEAFVGNRVSLKQDEFIKIIGDVKDDNIFKVEQIRPWIGNGLNNKNSGMMR